MGSSNFSSLRASRANALAKLNDEIKKENTKQGADERFWKLTVDQKTKVGYAKLRFLPNPKGEDVSWARVFNHAFKLNGSWFIENCPTTLGQRACPVCKDNSKLWNSGLDADKDVARERKRKLQFISNILVLEDPAHPENNGKVFLFKYGKKIHDKVQELINPQFPDQAATNPFDLWEGADFKLKSSLVKAYQNYDQSSFTEPKEVFPGDDAKKEELWEKEYSLIAFVAEDQFKSYEDLEKRFLKVLTGESDNPKTAADAVKAEQTTTLAEAASIAETVAAAEPETGVKATRTRKTKEKAADKPVVAPVVPEVTAPENEDEIAAFFGEVLGDDE